MIRVIEYIFGNFYGNRLRTPRVLKKDRWTPLTICGRISNSVRGRELRGSLPLTQDISAVGFWSPQELSFFDVRIFNSNSPSYAGRGPSALYTTHENTKKNDYINRVQNVERGSFTPLIYSTSGGWGKEAATFHTRLAILIAQKRKQEYCI